MEQAPTLKENIGYGSCLTGILLFVLACIWFINTFLTPGSPALFERRLTVYVMLAGIVLCLFGITLIWSKGKK
ncbi:hypothetical protein KBD34_02975 [Patescibacteria group bacterium]|nr:hypothetical protein [Patescibacteria group bacterium]